MSQNEPDLDFDDEPLAPEADAAAALVRVERSVPRYPSGTDWAAYFRQVREARGAAKKVEAGGIGTPILHEVFTHATDFPAAPKRLVATLHPAWEARLQRSTVLVSPLVYVAAGDEHEAGDERTPEHLRRHYGVQARLRAPGGIAAAWWAVWVRREIPGRKPGNTFESALCWDAVQGQWSTGRVADFEQWLTAVSPRVPE